MFDIYNARLKALGGYEGNAKRINSQKIMDASWKRDTATLPVYAKWVDSGLPTINDNDKPLYAKYNVKTYHNITGDAVAYLLQFRLEDMKENPNIKVGCYVKIPNEIGDYEWWLIVYYDDRPQFRQFFILKCTWVYKWVATSNGVRRVYECLGAPRKQNSYNSGVWLDYTTQTVENQDVVWLPTNSDTKTIYYDCKFLKSETGRVPPLAYKISKIEDTAVLGITKFTMTQEQFDPSRDNVDLMIGNYYDGSIEPELPTTEENPVHSNFEFVYTGDPAVRAGGGFKKFTVKQNIDNELVDISGISENDWSIEFPDGDKSKLEYVIENNIIRVKCLGEYSLIGKIFTITVKIGDNSKSLNVEVASL
jgi:hypothetical protein